MGIRGIQNENETTKAGGNCVAPYVYTCDVTLLCQTVYVCNS